MILSFYADWVVPVSVTIRRPSLGEAHHAFCICDTRRAGNRVYVKFPYEKEFFMDYFNEAICRLEGSGNLTLIDWGHIKYRVAIRDVTIEEEEVMEALLNL